MSADRCACGARLPGCTCGRTVPLCRCGRPQMAADVAGMGRVYAGRCERCADARGREWRTGQRAQAPRPALPPREPAEVVSMFSGRKP